MGRIAPRVTNANGSFTCSCSTGFYCTHIKDYFAEGKDVGLHTVISSTTKGRASTIYLPLTDHVIMQFTALVVEHPAVENEFMLLVMEKNSSGGLALHLSRYDSLNVVIRTARDLYRWSRCFDACLTQIKVRKRLPCPAQNHGRNSDLKLVSRIKRIAEFGLDPLTSEYIEFINELALEDAYHITKFDKCMACHLSEVNPADVAPDLIPQL